MYKFKFIVLTIFSLFVSIANATTDLSAVNMPFMKNIGQAPKHVAYYVSTAKATIYIDKNNGINYNFKQNNKSLVIRENFYKGHPVASIQNQQTTQINVIKGKDASKWHKNIPNATEINLGEVWQGIEVKLLSRPGNVEKLFILKPQASVKSIQLSLSGTTGIFVADNGQLAIQTDVGEVTFTRPIAWQMIDDKKVPIQANYKVDQKNYGFKLGKYDHSKEVIIDPLLGGTYIGGNLDEITAGIHVNSANEIIVAGTTSSVNFPTTVGVFSETNSGFYDFIAMRFNADMSQLLAATYFGGSSYDAAAIVAFDVNDNIYFAGESRSSDFPFPASPYVPYQQNEDANGSIFIAALSADFSTILGATHIGGDIVDLVRDMDIAANGNIYLTGFTNSNNYPYTAGALETAGKGIIISVFNPDLSQLLYSTRLGNGNGYAINVDTDGSIYLAAGKTGGDAYTTTTGVYSEIPINSLGEQIYLAHLNATLTTLNSATFIAFGTPNHLEFTPDNQMLISARTTSGGFPVPMGAFDNTRLLGGSTTLFKMDKTMTTITSATFLDMGFEKVLVEDNGNILVFGLTSTQDFPGGISPTDPLNTAYHGGPQDFAIARLNSDLTQVSHSAYIGGSNNETSANGLTLDTAGNVIVAGITSSNDVFLTANAFDTTNAGNGDIIILKATQNLNFGPFIDGIFCDSFESPSGNGACL